ncbi:MAG: zinc-binding dehydrogenase [Gemmatimonadales bacterium]|nr:zinc-binding dehydrogenase [Gemmatimonadales bacterium]
MLAVTIRAYGGPDQLGVEDVPRPAPESPHDVVVAVRAAALNHLDLFVLGGLPGVIHDFPHVVGSDGAGVVDSVGPSVTRVKPGDRVILNPGVSCGSCEYCLAGEESLCKTYSLLGEHIPGTIAEAVRVPEANVYPISERVPWTDAAAFPLVFLTAWRMLTTRAALRPSETVLLWGIGGGVALASLAIAKRIGARVIATSSSDAKLERARALGADATINHRTGDVLRDVRRITGRRGADVVVDSVGTDTWETSCKCLAPAGRLVTCGGTSGPLVQTDVRRLFWYHHTIMGSTMGNAREFAEITRLLSAGELRPVVDGVYSMPESRRAFERMASGEQFGKIVVQVAA